MRVGRSFLFVGIALVAAYAGSANAYDIGITMQANDGSGLSVGSAVTLTVKAVDSVGNGGGTINIVIPTEFVSNGTAGCVRQSPISPSPSIAWSVPDTGSVTTPSTPYTCTIPLKLNAAPAGTLKATANLTGNTSGDTNSSNNSASYTFTLKQTISPDVAVGLAVPDSTHQYAPGEAVSITWTVSASSAASASAVTAALNYPTTALDAVTATCGSASQGHVVWNVGNINASQSQRCTLTAKVNSTVASPINISASVTVAGDSNTGNNAAALTLPIAQPPKATISKTASGQSLSKPSTNIVLSGDGTTALFESQQTDLTSRVGNTGGQDIYSVGASGQPVLESVDSQGNKLTGVSGLPALSADGSVVAFLYSSSTTVLAKTQFQGQMLASSGNGQPTHPVAMGMNGVPPNGSASGAPSVSSTNGSKKLVFCSLASNLVASDTNNANDVFLVDPTNSTLPAQLVSTDSNGVQLAGDSCEPTISADGTKVVFTVSSPSRFGTSARQVVRKDLVTQALDIISVTPSGGPATADNAEPSIDVDGRVIAFTSSADLDGLGAPVGGSEVFASVAETSADGATRVVKRLRTAGSTVPNGASMHPRVSADGTIVVLQSNATNFLGGSATLAKDASPAPCVIQVGTNMLPASAVGPCDGKSSNQNPSSSGDGKTIGYDSDSSGSGGTGVRIPYTQGNGGSGTTPTPAALSSDFSGLWVDPNQNGQGLVIDVLPQSAGRAVNVTWFVFSGGQATWLQGTAIPHAGTGAHAGQVTVQIDQVGIFHGKSFPLGEASATGQLWGSITLAFADANTGTMSWTSKFPGFNSGTMPMQRIVPLFPRVSLPSEDPPGAVVKACSSGNWFNPSQSGHGFELEVYQGFLVAYWFAFDPTGAPVWLYGGGAINGNVVDMQFAIASGGQFPPAFAPSQVQQKAWGDVKFTFSDATHAHVDWTPTIAGYTAGSLDIAPLYGLDLRTCH
jgi:Domain of unknown function DUF11/WD40-like Beta Propeller Repeat